MSGWDPAQHPRVPAGTATGGRFTDDGGIYFSGSGSSRGIAVSDAEVRDFTEQHLGRRMSRGDVARAAGALPGNTVEIVLGSGDRIGVEIEIHNPDPDDPHPIGTAFRSVYPDHVDNDGINIAERYQGRGIGLQIFSSQVEAAAKLGFSKIRTQAIGEPSPVRGDRSNGSWTWARMGYDGPIPNAGRGPQGERTIHELMSTPAGTAWWKANYGAFSGTFDLRPGSTSMRVLSEYRRLKEAELATRRRR